MKDRSDDGEAAGVGAEADAGDADAGAEDDGEPGCVGLHEVFSVEGAHEHAANAYQSKEADDNGVVFVWWRGEEEGECCPVGREGGGIAETDRAGVHEDGVASVQLEDGVDHAEVVETTGVRGGVVWHEEPEEGPDEILQGKGDPVDVAPGGVVGDDAGKDTSDNNAEKVAGDDN